MRLPTFPLKDKNLSDNLLLPNLLRLFLSALEWLQQRAISPEKISVLQRWQSQYFLKLWRIFSAAVFFLAIFMPSCGATFQGPYIGAHMGLLLMDGVHKYTNNSSKEGKILLSEFGYAAGVQGGYMQYIGDSKTIMGAEIMATMAGINSTKELRIPGNTAEGKFNIRHRYALGLGILGGVVLNPKVMMYTKISFESNRLEITYSDLTFQRPSTQKFSLTLRNLVPSLGGYYRWGTGILVGAEYGYSIMPKRELRSAEVTINGANRGYTFNANEHRLVAKMVYVF